MIKIIYISQEQTGEKKLAPSQLHCLPESVNTCSKVVINFLFKIVIDWVKLNEPGFMAQMNLTLMCCTNKTPI